MSAEIQKIETLFERDEKTHKVYPDRLKNPVYGIFKSWVFTEKVDGTSMRVIWDAGRLTFRGRSDNAQVPPDLLAWMTENIRVEAFQKAFEGRDVTIYGEGYGAGIQKGGFLSPVKKFIAFDVFIPQGERGWYLNDASARDVCGALGIDFVPFVGNLSLEEGVEMVRRGFLSALGEHPPAEGLVGRPCETLYDKKGARIIIKLKTRDF